MRQASAFDPDRSRSTGRMAFLDSTQLVVPDDSIRPRKRCADVTRSGGVDRGRNVGPQQSTNELNRCLWKHAER